MTSELEQPTPTGEVTREHRDAVSAALVNKVASAWVDHPSQTFGLSTREVDLLTAASQLLATREAAAYQRGRDEAQGGWAPKVGDRVEHASSIIRAPGTVTSVSTVARVRWDEERDGTSDHQVFCLRPLPPPSDPSKGGR